MGHGALLEATLLLAERRLIDAAVEREEGDEVELGIRDERAHDLCNVELGDESRDAAVAHARRVEADRESRCALQGLRQLIASFDLLPDVGVLRGQVERKRAVQLRILTRHEAGHAPPCAFEGNHLLQPSQGAVLKIAERQLVRVAVDVEQQCAQPFHVHGPHYRSNGRSCIWPTVAPQAAALP